MTLSMRVLLLVNQFPPIATSAARLYGELAEALLTSGYEVRVVTTRPNEFNDSETGPPGIDICRTAACPLNREVPFFRAIAQLWSSLIYAWKAFRGPTCDVILAYSPPLLLGWTAHLLSRIWKAPWILNVQDLYPDTAIDLGLLRNPYAIRLAQRLEAATYSRAHVVTVHSEGNREHILGFGVEPERVVTIPNWVDVPEAPVTEIGHESDPLAELGLEDRFVIFYGGAIGFAQGLDDVLEAADRLRDHGDITFLILGGGSNRDRVVAKAQAMKLPNVRFHPRVSHAEYLRFLVASDVALVPLRQELSTPVVPAKLQEIMAAGQPVLAYTNPASDTKRIVERAKCGVHVTAGKISELTRTVESMAAGVYDLSGMGRNGHEYATNHFQRADATASYLKIIRRLTKN